MPTVGELIVGAGCRGAVSTAKGGRHLARLGRSVLRPYTNSYLSELRLLLRHAVERAEAEH
jgi:hypothetical protein